MEERDFHSCILEFSLSNFRSYADLQIQIGNPLVVLFGENGVGKTNLLEAISLFSQGKGLRRADLGDMIRQGLATQPSAPRAINGFSIHLVLSGDIHLGFGYEQEGNGTGFSRRARINRETVSSAKAFSEYIRLVWLTPSMDGLLVGPPADRRRFLDRLVLTLDSEHGARSSALEKSLRNRNKLLELGAMKHTKWLDAAEAEVAALGVAVAAARVQALDHLTHLIFSQRAFMDPFPWAKIHLSGILEERLGQEPALHVEDFYRKLLYDNRGRDALAGRTLIGPHTSDLRVYHGPKDLEAAQASTGEQKALLIGLILAQARLVRELTGLAPVLLLDEITAHLDPSRRQALFEILLHSRNQVFMTGADQSAFKGLSHFPTTYMHVSQGTAQVCAKPF